jgi:hypothetical protein
MLDSAPAHSPREQLLGPRIVTAGPLVDGDPPIWGSAFVLHGGGDARAEMPYENQEQGYDFLKIYNNIDSDTFDAIASTSKEIGYPFAGHCSGRGRYERMVLAGARSIEHLAGFDGRRAQGGADPFEDASTTGTLPGASPTGSRSPGAPAQRRGSRGRTCSILGRER